MKTNFSFANKCFIHSLLLCFVLSVMILPTVGCNSDEVIATLQTADAVDQAAIAILAPVNSTEATVLSGIDQDLQTVIKGYQDYEAALATDKASKGAVVKATIATITGNLQSILSDVAVKNPERLAVITKYVAVVNSALLIVLAAINGNTASAQALVLTGNNLPVVAGAKTHKDLRSAWNNAVKSDFPNAVVK